jgi:hypothetical protein
MGKATYCYLSDNDGMDDLKLGHPVVIAVLLAFVVCLRGCYSDAWLI